MWIYNENQKKKDWIEWTNIWTVKLNTKLHPIDSKVLKCMWQMIMFAHRINKSKERNERLKRAVNTFCIYAYCSAYLMLSTKIGPDSFFHSTSFSCYFCSALMYGSNEKLILCNNNLQRFPWMMSRNRKRDAKNGLPSYDQKVKDCTEIYGFLVFTHFSEWISVIVLRSN